MKLEIVGFEETREVDMRDNDLVPSDEIKHYFELKFPSGHVERVRVTKKAFDEYFLTAPQD